MNARYVVAFLALFLLSCERSGWACAHQQCEEQVVYGFDPVTQTMKFHLEEVCTCTEWVCTDAGLCK